MAEETKKQINAEMDPELVEILDTMRGEDEQTRSGFIRKLIRDEWARRNGRQAPVGTRITE